jgi:hypothetical protein
MFTTFIGLLWNSSIHCAALKYQTQVSFRDKSKNFIPHTPYSAEQQRYNYNQTCSISNNTCNSKRNKTQKRQSSAKFIATSSVNASKCGTAIRGGQKKFQIPN